MNFPVNIAFRILALAPQMLVTDADGRVIGFVREKLLRLVDDVTIFSDETQATPIYAIKADRIIDFSACYHFSDAHGRPLGHVQRAGMRSLWSANYSIHLDGAPAFEVNEENPIVRLLDGLLDEIPFVGIFTGLFLNPTYLVTRTDGGEALRITKRPSLLETDFRIDQLGPLDDRERECALLAGMMIILLERRRG